MPAFVVEDGTIVANASSYVSVTEADDILSLFREFSTSWPALAQSDKETWLMFATSFLDVHTAWNGYKTDPDNQVLDWPRTSVYDCEEIAIDSNIIPFDLKRSTSLLAAYYAKNTSINPADPLDSQIDIYAIRLEGIGITFDRRKGKVSTQEINLFPSWVQPYLGCLGKFRSPVLQTTSSFGEIC